MSLIIETAVLGSIASALVSVVTAYMAKRKAKKHEMKNGLTPEDHKDLLSLKETIEKIENEMIIKALSNEKDPKKYALKKNWIEKLVSKKT